MKANSILALAVCALLMPLKSFAQEVTITVTNDEKCQRQEVVEVDADAVFQKLGLAKDGKFIVKNALGQEVGYQLTYDGKLLIDASVRPCGSAVFTVKPGIPQPMKVFVTGKQYPERVDDIAWENDRTAYRVYGPALQRSGERAFGVDVWLKNTPDLEVSKRYATELGNHSQIDALKAAGKTDEAFQVEIATTYHFDHGYGLDCYKVGPSLGCGAPALMEGKELILPYCYASYKILDNGPLRFTVELTYNPTEIKGDKNVVEHRIISLDKGSNFNKAVVWYDGLSKARDVAAGVVVHAEDTESVVLGKNFVQYADPTDNPSKQNFQIFVATLFPEGDVTTTKLMSKKPANGIAGHAVGVLKNYKSGNRFTYYFGSAWSKNDVRTQREWQLRIDEFLEALATPLHVNVK
ncbi:MAG: DUF4861 domain-containing protein [Prevotella sp.]|nr:DUF4861 domain-containing protein [Prevotella sp.]